MSNIAVFVKDPLNLTKDKSHDYTPTFKFWVFTDFKDAKNKREGNGTYIKCRCDLYLLCHYLNLNWLHSFILQVWPTVFCSTDCIGDIKLCPDLAAIHLNWNGMPMALTSDRSICSSVGFISPASSARSRMTNDVSNLEASRRLLFKSRAQLCFFSPHNHRSTYDTLKNKIKPQRI